MAIKLLQFNLSFAGLLRYKQKVFPVSLPRIIRTPPALEVTTNPMIISLNLTLTF